LRMAPPATPIPARPVDFRKSLRLFFINLKIGITVCRKLGKRE
jgi:hypothetical protein